MGEPVDSASEVRLHIDGEHGTIDVAALHTALGALLDLFRAGGIRANLVISGLQEGSVEMAVRPRHPDPATDEAFTEIVRSLGDLSDEQVDQDWDTSMFQSAVSLTKTLDFAGVDGLVVTTPSVRATITSGTGVTAQKALEVASLSIGSVIGRIDRYNNHNKAHEVGLYDEATGQAVTVTFTQGQEPKVRSAIGRTVEAWGELRRDRDGRKRLLKLDDFRVLTSPESTPTLDELAGSLGENWTGGQGSVEAVRSQRDG